MKKLLVRAALVAAVVVGVGMSAAPAVQAAPRQPGSAPAAAGCPDGDCHSVKVLSYDFQAQQTSYWCGPAATRAALTARTPSSTWKSQQFLAWELGTTVNGTDTIAYVTRELNQWGNTGWYVSKYIPGSMATQAEINLLQYDVRLNIRNGYPLVANVLGWANDTSGTRRSYPGGHYLTVVGYRAGGQIAVIFDPARGEQYDMYIANLAHWIAVKGYSA